ncbi:thiol-disulfide oxidoreductase ResA [bacterium BMS3Abin11]|nr:thiol-disulfide oxidoreductase ResA [bacterium BMS3Abin11]GMT39869.1 MAG: protein disulfide oxidoreductase [bacterium]
MTPGKKTLMRHITQVLIILAVFLGVRAYLTQGTIKSGPAPDFGGALMDGSTFQLKDLRGKPALIYFWATWCKVCEWNDGAINDLAKDMPVITVVMESGSQKGIREKMKERGLSFPVFVDGLGKLADLYHVKGLPTNYIIDAEGNIRYVEVGYTTGWGLRFRIWLASFD